MYVVVLSCVVSSCYCKLAPWKSFDILALYKSYYYYCKYVALFFITYVTKVDTSVH